MFYRVLDEKKIIKENAAMLATVFGGSLSSSFFIRSIVDFFKAD